MTFPSQVPSITYNGDNVTLSWVYNFEIPYQSDGVTPAVRVFTGSPTGIDTVLVLGTDYTITGVGNLTGGTIVTTNVVAAGWTITIQRALHADQLTAFPNQGFLATDIEAALDKLTMLVQDASLGIGSPLSGPLLGVTTFNGRAGAVVLTNGDITAAGGATTASLANYAPLASPNFTGNPLAPTPAPGNNSTAIATTAFVAAAIAGSTSGVSSFNGRTGAVSLTQNDVTNVGAALTVSPVFTGTPQGPTALAGTSNTQLATTQFVGAAIAAIPGGTGTVTNVSSATADLSVVNPTSTPTLTVNAAPKWSVARTLSFTGDVTGSGSVDGTANVGTALTLATVNANTGVFGDATHVPQITLDGKGRITAAASVAITGTGSGVTSFNTRTGAVTLSLADVTGAGGGTVSSVGLSMPSDVTVTNSPVTGSGTLTVTRNSQLQNLVLASPSGAAGVPTYRALVAADIPSLSGTYLPLSGGAITGPVTAPTPTAGDNTTNVATTAFVHNYLPLAGGTMTGQLTVGGPTGIRFNKAAGANNNILFGATAGSNRWQVILGNSTTEGGSNAGSDFAIQNFSDTAVQLGTPLLISRATGNATFSSTVTSSPLFIANGGAVNRGLEIQTNGSNRWLLVADSVAESGSNAGSNFNIGSYADDGVTWSGSYFAINRATGNCTHACQTVTIAPPTSVWAMLVLNKPASGLGNQLVGQTNGSQRWDLELGDPTAESGSNAGSNFVITRYADNGGGIGQALVINRATGNATFAASVSLTSGSFVSNAAAGNNRGLLMNTAGVQRWGVYANATAEGGSNSGSDFVIVACNDAGSQLSVPLTIIRSNGVANFGNTIYLGSYPGQGTLQPVVGYFVSGSWWNAERLSVSVSGTSVQTYYNSGASTTTWSSSPSDRRLKSNIKSAKTALDFIKKIKVYDLNFTPGHKISQEGMPKAEAEHWPFSMIADEVAKVLPHATIKVTEDDGEHHVALHPTHLISVLWKAVQELTERVEALEAR